MKADPEFIRHNMADICASYQHRIVSYLIMQLEKAAIDSGIREIGISGGVAANSYLRKLITQKGATMGWNIYIPALQYCTDNAAMVAIAASFKYDAGVFADQATTPYPRKKQ